LGGKTKTCIIATISPSVYCLEETLSTLDYAHRAKNIKNKPEINQRMMKSAMIKDLYYEIDRLKQEVFAAREKNGIYIPRERYLQEEAEKKAMTEKIERLGADLEARDKQLVELKELYDAEQLLSAELGEKLGKTQKDLEDTKSALHDLEEKYNEAKSTIKEKEYVIFNLLKSGFLRSCLILFCSFVLLRLFGKFMYATDIQFTTFQGFHGSSMLGFN
jgi:kinesin family protein 11